MERISQVDLDIGSEELALVADAIERRWLTEGPFVARLRDQISARLDVKHVSFAPNGTLGLFLALLALDLPRGGEVVMPAFTFYASAMSAVFAGLKPIFVDVDPETLNADADAFEAAITPNTVALMPVHIYGQCCDIGRIADLGRRTGIRVVEDAAQAFSVKCDGRAAGTFGDIGVYSFFSDKIITSGEGGVVVTNDDALHERIALMRNQGRPNAGTFVHPEIGMNFRITDLHAGIALAQMQKLDAIVTERLRKWALYERALHGVGDLRIMRVRNGSGLAPFRFPIMSAHRDRIAAALEQNGVQTRGFFVPMHLQPKLQNDPPISLPHSERLHAEGLCLPIHPHISDADVERVCEIVQRSFN